MSSRWERMSPKARESARERNRRWRARHLDEQRERDRVRRAADPEGYRKRNHAYYLAHTDRARELGRKYATDHPHIHVLYAHGVQPSELVALYDAQGGRCAVCDKPAPMRGPGCLHIDHDHDTGERRGLICNECNRALPLVERLGATWALRALTYLGDPPLRRLRKKERAS